MQNNTPVPEPNIHDDLLHHDIKDYYALIWVPLLEYLRSTGAPLKPSQELRTWSNTSKRFKFKEWITAETMLTEDNEKYRIYALEIETRVLIFPIF